MRQSAEIKIPTRTKESVDNKRNYQDINKRRQEYFDRFVHQLDKKENAHLFYFLLIYFFLSIWKVK